MDPTNSNPKVHVRHADRAVSTSTQSVRANPEELAAQVRAYLSRDLYLPAREAAAQAVRRFPEHPEIQKLWRVFDNRGKSWVVEGETEPSTDDEFEWLRKAPDWARGKWVALIGREVVAMADSLKEVVDTISGLDLQRRPLVHRVD